MPRAQGRWKEPLPDARRRGRKRRAQGRAEWELATWAIHLPGHRRAPSGAGLAPIDSRHARGACQSCTQNRQIAAVPLLLRSNFRIRTRESERDTLRPLYCHFDRFNSYDGCEEVDRGWQDGSDNEDGYRYSAWEM